MQRLFLAVFVSLAVIATTYAETTCQNHQRNSRSSAHGLSWNIKCDANGDYEPLQCTNAEREKDKWCGCYNKEEQVSGPSKNLRFCHCSLAKREAVDAKSQCPPQCARNGKYEKKQCCGQAANRKCHCVNEDTGAKTSDPTTNANLTC